MSITAQQILDWAEGTSSNPEVDDRATVSRAYYAAYHRCREWHSALPRPGRFPSSRAGLHEELIYQLWHPDVTCSPRQQALSKKLAGDLDALKGLRTRADYHLRQRVTSTDAQQACIEAGLILAAAI